MGWPDWAGYACVVATVAWGAGGAAYSEYRLRALRAATARGRHQLALSRSSRDPFTRKLLLRKAQATVAAHRQAPGRVTRWHNRVYAPVLVVLALGDLAFAAYEVTK